MASTEPISNLLEKMESIDKDFRFMATNDLIIELGKERFTLDDSSQWKVVRALEPRLKDENTEVQNLAVKCIGPLIHKVKDNHVEWIVETLCTYMVSTKERLGDISTIGLKNVIKELPLMPRTLATNVCIQITRHLSTALDKQKIVSVQLEILDLLSDLLSKFGKVLEPYHASLMEVLLRELFSQRQAIRKRTIIALSHLVVSCDLEVYLKIIDHLVDGLTNVDTTKTHTIIECFVAICRQPGHRFENHIERIIPFILKYINEDDDELKGHCIQAFEAFVYQYSKEITPYIEILTNLCLQYITYYPNFNYDVDDSDEEEEDVNMKTKEDVDQNEFDDFSDNEDMSWIVRRSAAKCLTAIVSTRSELLPQFYKTVSPALITAFKEREENVKFDLFRAYVQLLRQTKPTTDVSLDRECMEHDDIPICMLQTQVPSIVEALEPQIKDKNIETRQHCFILLKELVAVLPGAMSNHMPVLISGIQYSLEDKDSSINMKVDTLNFLYCLLSSHPPEVFHPHMEAIVLFVIAAVEHSHYKISSEALHVLQQIVKVIRPLDSSNFDFAVFIKSMYTCTFTRFVALDIDSEVKDSAICCMGQIICNLGDYLQTEVRVCLALFLDRLRNEVTRLTTIKVLTEIAASPLKIDLFITGEIVEILGPLLRLRFRTLKLNTLSLLDVLVRNYKQYLNTTLLRKVISEMPPLLNEDDIQVMQLTLTLLTSIIQNYSDALVGVTDTILPRILNLATSPTLQGAALDSMLNFFQTLVSCRLPNFGYNEIIEMLIVAYTGSRPETLAKCIAAVAVTNVQEALSLVGMFMKDITANNDAKYVFSMLVIGEIGRHIDVSTSATLKEVILDSFSHVSEEVKTAASYTLASVSIGNLPEYLPFILQLIEEQPRRRYLLLHSLKEIILSQSTTSEGVQQLLPFVPTIWTLLFQHCECIEDSIRNVVAECLAKLTLIDSTKLLPKLQEALKSNSPLMRITVVSAVKFTISDQPQTIDLLLKQCIGKFLDTLQDPDTNVRRVALIVFNSAARKKPFLIIDLLDSILPLLYNETKIKMELIRQVEVGPFTYKVDDGLDSRKAAFECMDTLLDSFLDRLNISEFLIHLEDGLKDHYDIKMLTYLMTAKLAQLCPHAVLLRLSRLVQPLRVTCNEKVDPKSVKQDYEKQNALKKSAMRAVVALLTIPNSNENQHLNNFVSEIKSSMELGPVFESIQKDTGKLN